MRRGLGIALVVLAVAACALAGGAWWAARSETALAWVMARLEGLTGGRVRIESPRGSLLGPIRAARVIYADEDVRVTATEVALDLRLRPLLGERLEASEVAAQSVRIEILPTPSTGPPDSMGVPLEIVVERFSIASVVLVNGAETLEFGDVAGAYRGGPQGHRLELARARTPWGDTSGLATLGAEKPFPVVGGVRFLRRPGPSTRPPVSRGRSSR
jgi:autotransporter translocation and assembly factor TamB